MNDKISKYIKQFKNTTQSLDPADERLKKLDINFVRTLTRITETYPGIHDQSKYIAEKSLLVAGVLDLNAEETEDIFYAGMLIQLGKITLPTSIRTKPFYLMSTVHKYHYLEHAVEGGALLHHLTQFKDTATLIRHQYERYNGQGFPDSLKQLNIPIGSRILSVVRDYIEFLNGSITGIAMPINEARNQLIIRKESYYDPDVVDIFVNVIKGTTVDELKDALAKSKLSAIATEQWKKGLLIRKKATITDISSIVEISLQQLKVGMKVDSIYFGSEVYIRKCIVDQSIINNITTMQKTRNQNPIIKIFLKT